MRIPLVILLVLLAMVGRRGWSQNSWQETLASMPLSGGTQSLERDNVVRRILEGLQSNAVVKAIVVLPAVSDDLYLINRDKPRLNLRATNLLGVIAQLTNATEIRATFRPPFLLMHRDEDFLEAQFTVKDTNAVARLQAESRLPRGLFCDAHWEQLRPALNKKLRPSILPWSMSGNAWHFARHNLAGWNLTDWEWLVAVSLSGKTSFTVEKRRVIFQKRSAP